VHVVELDNGAMCVDVLPTRGMGIWRVRRGDKTLGWRAPATEPVHPAFAPVFDPSGLGWLEGFNELLCRCGLESNGAPDFDSKGRLLYPLHGRIANLPASRVELIEEEEAGRLMLRGVVDETRFHFQSLRLTSSISTAIGSNEFTWTDEVENIGGREATMQILYHFNVGQPLLRPGAKVLAPVAAVAPLTKVAADEGVDSWNIMPPPRPGSPEQVYVLELLADDAGDTRGLVSGLTDDEAVGLKFDKTALPCLTIWRNTPAECDGYVIGVEPGTNYPNPRTFEQKHGRVITLNPGETWRASVSITWHADVRTIVEEENTILTIQSRARPEIARSPRADWSSHV
jgi:galactose mutarotase-like enzyme